jgi:hypothetical protein
MPAVASWCHDLFTFISVTTSLQHLTRHTHTNYTTDQLLNTVNKTEVIILYRYAATCFNQLRGYTQTA